MKLAAILSTAAVLSTLAVFAPTEVQGYTNPVTIKGYKMFDAKTGAYFAAKGIDYYPRPNAGKLDANNIDFFTDAYYDVWSKDIEYLAATGANAVRLYAVDPSQSQMSTTTAPTPAPSTTTKTTTTTQGTSASSPLTAGAAMSAISACMALAVAVSFA